MRYIRITSSGPQKPPNLLLQILGFVVGIIAFIGAAVIGGIVLAALVGFALVAGIVVYGRILWLTRKAMRAKQGDSSFVDAEYEVVSRDEPPKDGKNQGGK